MDSLESARAQEDQGKVITIVGASFAWTSL